MATKMETHDKKKKTNKDDLMINCHATSVIKGLKIIDSLRQPKTTTKHDQSLKNSNSTSSKFENHQKNEIVMMEVKKVWDCESSLYDSYELKSFNRQLDSAISSSARSISMPHLPPPPPPSSESTSFSSKKQSPHKISRSLGKLIKSMFKQKHESKDRFTANSNDVDMDKYYVVFDKTGSLTTIPESGESTEMVGSRINSLVRKTRSERFTQRRLVGISCS